MATPPPPPRATLLGLPRELRRQLYDIILNKDVNYYVRTLSRFRLDGETPGRLPFFDSAEREPPILMPLAELAMTCSSLANEIRAHIRALPPKERAANFELTGDHVGLKSCFLRQMPFPVADLALVRVEVNIGIGNAALHHHLREVPRDLVCDTISTLRGLFHRRRGLLRRAAGVKDVQICLKVSKFYYSMLSDNGFRELAQEIRFLLDIGLEDSSGGKLFGERNARLLD
ncbi:hypothetical protein Q7P37_007777 [Cladosporium fusiforme]